MKKSINLWVPELSEGIDFNQLSPDEFIVCNSQDRHYLKVNKATFQLLSLVDGVKNLDEIGLELSALLSYKVSANNIYKLLYIELIEFGVLKGFEERVKPDIKPAYLQLSFIIFNDRIVSKVSQPLFFLFKQRVAMALVLIAVCLLSSLSVYFFDINKPINLQHSIIYFVGFMALSVTFHELGHATAAGFYGAKHGGIGGGFYLFSPVYFADVTDIWKLPKGERIIVNLAGIYFELLFCSVWALIGFFLGNETWTCVAILISIYSLFNLNPFLRSDGYWILSDLWNQPNLFQHATRRIREGIYKLGGRYIKWKKKDYFLLLYGLLLLSFMGTFLFYVLIVNPNSIIHFPLVLYEFIVNVVKFDAQASMASYGELVIPLVFYFLLFRLVKYQILSFKFKGGKKGMLRKF